MASDSEPRNFFGGSEAPRSHISGSKRPRVYKATNE